MVVLGEKNHKVKSQAYLKVQFKGLNFHPFSNCPKYKKHSFSTIIPMLQTPMTDSKPLILDSTLKNSLTICN